MNRKMKDSGIKWIGDIPENWDVFKLGQIGKFSASGIDKKVDPEEVPVKIVNYTDIYRNKNYKIDNTMDFMEVTCKLEKRRSHILEVGDLIFTPSSETVDEIGMSAVVYETQDNLSFSYHVLRYVANRNIDLGFRKYMCNNHFLYSYFSSRAVGSIRKTLNRLDFKEAMVILPPLYQQQKITNLLDGKVAEIDHILEKTRESIEEYKKYKQSIIAEAVTKGINPDVKMKDSGIEWIGQIPEKSNITKFGNIASIETNLVSPNEYENYLQVSPENIEKDSGKLLECKTVREIGIISNNHLFKKGQILYSKVRPALSKAIIAPFDGLCSADMYPIETILNSKYLLYYMLSIPFITQVTMNNNRVKMPKINRKELNFIDIVIPEDNDQEIIVNYLDLFCEKIDKIVEKKEKLILNLEAYKKSLIFECVTGKREVI